MNIEPIETKSNYAVAETDWFLQELVNLVNYQEIEIGITLQVSGMLVSGIMVSGPKYFEGFSEEFSSLFSGNPDAQDMVRNAFTKHGDIYRKREDEDETPPPQYIHLKDARYFNPSGKPIPDNRGTWWRGRVSEVGGFTLGTLSMNEI